MAKAKQSAKVAPVLTQEEIEQNSYQRALDFCKYTPPKSDKINFVSGQEVKYGGHIKCIILKSCQFDDRFYFVNVTTRDRDKGQYEHMECVAWDNLIDMTQVKDTSFYLNKNAFDLRFSNSTIESLWHMYTSAGLEMNPSYQRDYVWEDIDKEKLIDSIFEDSNIGTFVFAGRNFATRQKLYEIVDGKQRLTTIFDFIENKFQYKGFYFYQLSIRDKNAFMDKGIQFAKIESRGNRADVDEKTLLALFIYVNKTGKPQDPAFMQKIQERYNALS